MGVFIVVDIGRSKVAGVSVKSQEEALSKVVEYLKKEYDWVNEIDISDWEFVNQAKSEFVIYEGNDDIGFGFDMQLEYHEV